MFSDNLDTKIGLALNILRMNEYKALELSPDGYYLAFSGGKDSMVIHALAELAGVKFRAHYNCVGIDPPELVRFIRREYPDVLWHRSKHGPFFRRIPSAGLPTRRFRWCCAQYKRVRRA